MPFCLFFSSPSSVFVLAHVCACCRAYPPRDFTFRIPSSTVNSYYLKGQWTRFLGLYNSSLRIKELKCNEHIAN